MVEKLDTDWWTLIEYKFVVGLYSTLSTSLSKPLFYLQLEYAAIALATKHINKYAGTIPVILARH